MTFRTPPRRARPFLALILGAAQIVALGPTAAHPPAVSAGQQPITRAADTPNSPSVDTIEGYLRTWLNADRAAHGLRPLQLDVRLQSIARVRASTLASLNVLSHTAPGDLSSQLTGAAIQQFGWGEDIGWTSWTWGQSAAESLYAMWKASPGHWELMMSPDYNYVGIGLGYRQAGNATYSSIVFTESADHTAPIARMTSARRSGSTIRFTWTATDVPLQTHTAGLKSFDVEYRVSGSNWRVIRTGTTATVLRLSRRPSGHSYYLRVRARDHAGNVSAWSTPVHIWVR